MKPRHQRALTTLLCLVAALSCYGLGLPNGTAGFVIAGILFELLFWLRLLRRAPNRS